MGGAGGLEQQAVYQIRVRGTLDGSWSDWFGGLALEPLETGDTLLTGPVVDQAALYGVLWKLRDLNLPLISVALVERDSPGQGLGLTRKKACSLPPSSYENDLPGSAWSRTPSLT